MTEPGELDSAALPTVTQRPLTAADLLPAGPLGRIGGDVRLLATIDSTNAFLLREAAALPDGTVAWAEFQDAGRGRLGRRWEAPRGSSILLSVLLHESQAGPLIASLGLAVAVSATHAIAEATDCTPAIRWPNDLTIGGRKLAGILVETQTLRTGGVAAVVGIGVNCLQHRGHFPPDLRHRLTSLELESAHAVARGPLAAGILRHLDEWLHALAQDADAVSRLRTAWRAACADVGTRVTLQHDNRTYVGTALDIDDAGDLLVQLDEGGRRHFVAATTTRVWETPA